MTVTEYEGRWAVVNASGNVVAKFATNEAAWSWIDRQERRPLWRTARTQWRLKDDAP